MKTEHVSTRVYGTTHVVQLDDSAVNALTLELLDDLSEAITAAERGDALVVAGRAGTLTAGLDRSAMLSGDRAVMSTLLRRVTGLYDQILRHPAPTVVACTGHALAAGALLLLVADARIGTTAPCKIGFNETQIGLPLGPLAVAAARVRLAPQSLHRATLHGTIYGSQEAVDMGFLDDVVEPDAVVSTAVDRATELGRLDRRSYLRTRGLVWEPVLAEVEASIAKRRAGARAPSDA